MGELITGGDAVEVGDLDGFCVDVCHFEFVSLML